MSRILLSFCLFLLLIFPAILSAAEPEEKSLDALSFMVGSWRQTTGKTEVEEHWLPAKGNLMLGLGRTVCYSSHN